MAIETVEIFECPSCKSQNFVRWDQPDLSERIIPCLSCFHDEWETTVLKEEWSEAKQCMVATEIQTTKKEVGCKFKVVRGSGIRTLTRDDSTFKEI